MKYFDEKAIKLWKDHVIANFPKIEVEPGQCRMNNRCHQNAVHDAVQNHDERIALVFMINDNDVFLHFINSQDQDEFTDNTQGYWTKFNQYYFVRWIDKNQFNEEIYDIFSNVRDEYTKMIPCYYRFLVNTVI